MNLIMRDTKHQYKPRIKRNLFTVSRKVRRLALIVIAVLAGVALAVLGTLTLLDSGYVSAAHAVRDEFGHTHMQQAVVQLPITISYPIQGGGRE